MRNLEYKAAVRELEQLRDLFAQRGASFSGILSQRDTYFNTTAGRLKLRETSGRTPELIFYERKEDSPAAMESRYSILQVSEPALKDFLAKALGVRAVVEKERQLLMLKNARIHLDEVKGLGTFIEFEVVSSTALPEEESEKEDAALLDKLKGYAAPFVTREINESYSDLLPRIRQD